MYVVISAALVVNTSITSNLTAVKQQTGPGQASKSKHFSKSALQASRRADPLSPLTFYLAHQRLITGERCLLRVHRRGLSVLLVEIPVLS